MAATLSIARICCPIPSYLFLVPVAYSQQHFLGINEVATLFAVVLQNTGLDNGVHRTGFFAETAKYAFGQVNVIARRTARAVLALLGFDSDRKCGTDRLAQLAGDTSLFSIWVAAQRMQTSEARR